MIDKEVAELRRRYRQDRSNITKIHGCYVNVHGELVSAFTLSMGLLPEGEQEKYLELLKKGGVMSLCIYSGGDTGFEERDKILDMLKRLDSRKYVVILSTYYNRENNPPIPVLIIKK